MSKSINAVPASFTASGQSTTGRSFQGYFNFSVWGGAGTVVLERSFDDGTTWLPLSIDAYGTAIALTAACSMVIYEPEADVQYRARCSAFSSGPINVRISQ